MLDGWGNPLSWANIGVQIFFFMSGWLYGNKDIADATAWFKRNISKIIVPYWGCLVVFIPVIALLSVDNVTFAKVLTAIFCLQGFGYTIEGIGQHWFVSYIVLCYLITPFILNRYRNFFVTKYMWLHLCIVVFVAQAITIPFALWFQFKVAYIFNYVLGYAYGVRYGTYENIKITDKKLFDTCLIIASIIGIALRIYLLGFEFYGITAKMLDCYSQWVKVITGCTIFILTINIIPADGSWLSDNMKKKIKTISTYTFEIYLVHEFFTCDMYTDLFDVSLSMKIAIVLLSIIIATIALVLFEKMFNCMKYSLLKKSLGNMSSK